MVQHFRTRKDQPILVQSAASYKEEYRKAIMQPFSTSPDMDDSSCITPWAAALASPDLCADTASVQHVDVVGKTTAPGVERRDTFHLRRRISKFRVAVSRRLSTKRKLLFVDKILDSFWFFGRAKEGSNRQTE